jgi:hypothetical protein
MYDLQGVRKEANMVTSGISNKIRMGVHADRPQWLASHRRAPHSDHGISSTLGDNSGSADYFLSED